MEACDAFVDTISDPDEMDIIRNMWIPRISRFLRQGTIWAIYSLILILSVIKRRDFLKKLNIYILTPGFYLLITEFPHQTVH